MVSNSAVNEIVSLGSCDCWPSIFRSFESPVFSRQFLQGVILKEAKHDVEIVVAKKLSIDKLHVYSFFLDRYLSDTHKVCGKAHRCTETEAVVRESDQLASGGVRCEERTSCI